MSFWTNTLSNVLGGLGAGLFFVLAYFVIQWFLQATDLVVSYNWRFDTVNGITSFRPNFDIRNRSRSKSYRLANIAYTLRGQPHWCDNKSVWGRVLEPGSINNDFEVSAVRGIESLQDALSLEVTIRTQSGRSFWLRGQGPNQQGKGRIRRIAFKLRTALESGLIPLE
jgi:hypothetical protein